MTTSDCAADHPGRACTRTAAGGYCLPPRCYCGACPWWRDKIDVPTYTPDVYTSFDKAAVESGRRRSESRRRLATMGASRA